MFIRSPNIFLPISKLVVEIALIYNTIEKLSQRKNPIKCLLNFVGFRDFESIETIDFIRY